MKLFYSPGWLAHPLSKDATRVALRREKQAVGA